MCVNTAKLPHVRENITVSATTREKAGRVCGSLQVSLCMQWKWCNTGRSWNLPRRHMFWSVQTQKSEHPTSLEVTVLSRSAEVKSPPTLKLPATVQAASSMVDSNGNASKSHSHSITTSKVASCESQVRHNLHTARGSMPQATHIQTENISTWNLDIRSLLGISMDTADKLRTGTLHSRLSCFHRMFQRSH